MSKDKTGTYLNQNARKHLWYIRVCSGPQRDEYLHRLIAEALLRRPLKPNETVDHKNTNPLDCHPRNIMVLSWSDHAKVTNARKSKVDLVEGVDYTVILDGEKIFGIGENDESADIMAAMGESPRVRGEKSRDKIVDNETSGTRSNSFGS